MADSPAPAATTDRTFTLWAPTAESVDLVLDGSRHAMTSRSSGYWSVEAAAADGARYGFSIDGSEPLADPRALRMPDGPHGLSAVFDPADFAWSPGESDWEGVELAGKVVYEMHVGTFTPERTFEAAIGHLDDLVELGVDIVEVMPVAGFPGRHGWGYDGVALWAVHEPYGGPEGLLRFVDAAHSRGLAVALDVVYNHLGPDGNYLSSFGPYFTERHETPWGAAVNLDGPDSDPVREFVIGNALHWLRDFHVDALRLDAVHELRDDRALHLLEELAIAVDDLEEETGRAVALIAESDRNDIRTVTAREFGGLGLDGQWADDVHHGLHAALTGESQGYYGDFALPGVLETVLTTPFLHAGSWSTFRGRTHGRPVDPSRVDGSQFVASLQTHDQVGNRRAGDRLSHQIDQRRLACGVALLLTGPFTPMLFMGEEWAASTPWQYFTDHTDDDLAQAVRDGRRGEFAAHGWDEDSVPDPQSEDTVVASTLDWGERAEGDHARTLAWYRALLALRRARADLRDGDLREVRVQRTPTAGAFVVERGRHRVAVNLSDEPVRLDVRVPGVPRPVVLLSLDPTVELADGHVDLAPESVVVVGPSAP
ncbi:malto-oligosyltrehalose trehalohydrolase [Agilicoccus flavus]|uniref:malto-oligosyltrehalose trehalohydrolase n=1 Tax=Agilicoccus flavus TaxID=2775968 RepID=UPI001CF654F4|nr:malto-oligosyltrehalose trehalohydrolase [Agilicoccus flavus]